MLTAAVRSACLAKETTLFIKALCSAFFSHFAGLGIYQGEKVTSRLRGVFVLPVLCSKVFVIRGGGMGETLIWKTTSLGDE